MQLPRIKRQHNPVRLSGGRIRIGTIQYGVGAEIQDDADGTIWLLLSHMDGTRTISAIAADMLRIRPELDRSSLTQAIHQLIAAGFVEDAGAPPPAELTADELSRYSRNASYFAWVDCQPRPSRYEVQRRLKNARVTILGLGGTGSAVALGLVASGIGALHCVDFDRVEASNLTRQLLYTEADIGYPKVERAVARLRQMNSHVSVTGQEAYVQSSDDLAPLMDDCDLFVLCADTPPGEIQGWTNEAALRARKPWLMSLYAGPTLTVGLFVPFQTPCYRCLEHIDAQRRDAEDGADPVALFEADGAGMNAVIAPTAGLTGHWGALEAIYFLGGLQPHTIGRVFHQNLMAYDHIYYVEGPFWDGCPACRPEAPVLTGFPATDHAP